MTHAPSDDTNHPSEIFGWMMYDWANSAFQTTVVTVLAGLAAGVPVVPVPPDAGEGAARLPRSGVKSWNATQGNT